MEMNCDQRKETNCCSGVVGICRCSVASQASAQNMTKRDAAIHKCISEAHRAFTGDTQDMQRSDFHKACMAKAGQKP